MPSDGEYGPDRHEEEVKKLDLLIPKDSFKPTVIAFDPQTEHVKQLRFTSDPEHVSNPQTEHLCNALEIDDPIALLKGKRPKNKPEVRLSAQSFSLSKSVDRQPTMAAATMIKDSLPSPIFNEEKKTADDHN